MPGRTRGEWHDGPPEWRLPRWATLWIPVVISLLAQLPASLWISRASGLTPGQTAITVLIALAGPLALIGARRFPGPVVAIAAVATSVDLLFSERGGPPYVALAFAIVSAIVRDARVWAWVSVGACWIATLSIAIAQGRADWTPFRIGGTTLGILVMFGIGEGLRSRRERSRSYREHLAQRRQSAVQAERVRIARELHDVLAHSLSQINVQAGVGLHLADRRPEEAREALASIKETSKVALDEVRAVLGVLRAEDGADPSAPLVPEPDLARIPGLAASITAQGIAVELDDRLDPARVPQNVQLAIYRIVQESLTNVVRHARGATRVRVELEERPDGVRVVVRDDGSGSRTPVSESGGRGVLGMRERAELLGGRLSAGPADDGGFVVAAVIPSKEVP